MNLKEQIPESLVREGDGPEGNFPMRARFEKMCREAQIDITRAIEEIDGSGVKFQEDCWVRANGGGGMSRVLSGGKVFEKAGVNLSVVYGSMPQEALQAATERGVDRAKVCFTNLLLFRFGQISFFHLTLLQYLLLNYRE